MRSMLALCLFAGAALPAMAFELSEYDERLLRYGTLFEERFMRLSVSLPLEAALDLGWLP